MREDLIKKAEAGDANAMFDLALLYVSQDEPSEDDFERAGHWMQKAAEAGHAGAKEAIKSYVASTPTASGTTGDAPSVPGSKTSFTVKITISVIVLLLGVLLSVTSLMEGGDGFLISIGFFIVGIYMCVRTWKRHCRHCRHRKNLFEGVLTCLNYDCDKGYCTEDC